MLFTFINLKRQRNEGKGKRVLDNEEKARMIEVDREMK